MSSSLHIEHFTALAAKDTRCYCAGALCSQIATLNADLHPEDYIRNMGRHDPVELLAHPGKNVAD